MSSLQAFERRLDRQAIQQLRQVAAAQAEEIDRLKDALWRAQEHADWCEENMREMEEACIRFGVAGGMALTIEGKRVLLNKVDQP